MHVVVVNLTSSTLGYTCAQRDKNKRESGSRLTLPPNASVDVQNARREFSLTAMKPLAGSADEKTAMFYDYALLGPYRCSLRRPIALGPKIYLLRTPLDCPWRLYSTKYNGRRTIYILPRRDPATFLSELPDAISLSDVCLPGTHDTMAFYGWPLSQCQSGKTPLAAQLAQGIRILDVRLSVIKGKLIAYHGAYPQRTPFQSILADLFAFLTASDTCGETVVVSIKQEDRGGDFSRRVREEIEASSGGMDLWWLENRIPTLGEARGRAIMFSRFGGDGSDWKGGLDGLGIHPTTWPDSAKQGFEWWCKDTLVRTQDWYAIPSFLDIPEKTALATGMLFPSPKQGSQVLSITYFSASSLLAMPPTVAVGWGWPSLGLGVEGVNSRVARFLLAQFGQAAASGTHEMPLRAWTFVDFYREPTGVGIVPLLIECNFRGR